MNNYVIIDCWKRQLVSLISFATKSEAMSHVEKRGLSNALAAGQVLIVNTNQ